MQSEGDTTEGDAATTILEGRLHPASIFLSFLAALRRTAIWLAVFAYQTFTAESIVGAIAGVFFMGLFGALSLVGPVVTWLRYRYRLTTKELAIDSGFIRRQQRRIPIARVQDLSFEAGPIHRMLGVVVVAVQTSGTEGAEAKLDAITREQGEALRDALRALGGRSAPEVGGAAPAPALLSVGMGALVLRGLTDNRAGLILAGVLGFVAQVIPDDDVSFLFSAWELGQRLLGPVVGGGAFAIAVFVLSVAALFAVLGWIGSALLNVIRFFGFTLREDEGVFSRSYGLFTKRMHALPRARIQAVRLKQTFLRRLFGLAELRTDDMGAGAQAKTAEAQGTDVFVPIAGRDELESLMGRVLSETDPTRYRFVPTSPRIIRRSASRFALLGGVIAALLWYVAGPWALAAPFLLAPLGALWGLAVFRTLGWAHHDDGLAVRRGVFRRALAIAPASRLQALTIVQSPFDRYHRVATLTAVVGGGARVAIPNVPIDDARAAVARLYS